MALVEWLFGKKGAEKTATKWLDDGNVLLKLKRYEAAIKCYDKAIEIDPNYASIWFFKGEALAELKRYEEAIKCYDKAIEINPNFEWAKNIRKIAEEKLRNKQVKTMPIVPGLFDSAKSLSSKANQLFQQKNYHSALQTYENALSHFTRAHEGAKALNDTDLATSISNNISALQKNIAACKNA
ncbi:MAG: tetratricopeptide repeat protein, partial [Candidatus Methanoperedens sp.]|nr:tetratricopeptide repeat protein [Candidatus Methanoperedens sp.]